MKTNQIRKHLAIKSTEWLDSITDKEVRKIARENAIITGGAVASLLLTGKVNDYDVYFKTKESLLSVLKYYCKDVCEILDGANYTDKTSLDTTSGFGIAVKNLTPDRVKLWLGGNPTYKPNNSEKPEEESYYPEFFSANAISLKGDVQLIVRFYGTAEEIHKNFDFVHATCSYDVDSGQLSLPSEALESIITKDLRYIGSLYPLTSIIRTRKFINRDWTVTAGTYLKIMFQISELNLSSYEVLEEQLIGVDLAYFNALLEGIRCREGGEDEPITYQWLSAEIDKIFDSSTGEE